jgi:hypothetical protein
MNIYLVVSQSGLSKHQLMLKTQAFSLTNIKDVFRRQPIIVVTQNLLGSQKNSRNFGRILQNLNLFADLSIV